MKELKIYEYLSKFQFFLFMCLVFTLPFNFTDLKFNSYSVVLLVLNSLVLLFFKKGDIKYSKYRSKCLFFSFLYLVYICGIINSDNTGEMLFELQRKISFLVIPFVFFATPIMQLEKVKSILFSFILGCVLAGVICLSGAIFLFLKEADSSFFFYHSLASVVGMSAIYLAMYFCFSIILLLFVFIKYSEGKSILYQMFIYFSLVFLFTMIVLLGSRMQIVILFAIILIYLITYLSNRLGVIQAFLITILAGVIFTTLVLMIPLNRERFKDAINYKNQYELKRKWGEQQIRYLIWNSSLELISNNFYTGVGTGDVQDELQSTYVKNEYISLTYFSNTQFNAHNQFLEIGVELGIGGMITLLLVLLVPLWYAFKNKNMLYAVFLLVFFISCLTESMLERQNGIVFYAFFNSLFFSYNINSKTVLG